MQQIARMLNQPATTFLWPEEKGYGVNWFAPDAQIELCGHGALAAVAYLERTKGDDPVVLHYTSGSVSGYKSIDNTCSLEFKPIKIHGNTSPEKALIDGLGDDILEYYPTGNKNIVLLKNEEAVRTLKPDFERLKQCKAFGFIVTAPGESADFVSRTLVPHIEQLEDPATGSSHVVLTSFWGRKLGKNNMKAHQLSRQGGEFLCELHKDHVKLTGQFAHLANGHLDASIFGL